MTASAPPLPRFDQGFLAIALLTGFVFSAPWLIPLAGLSAASSAVRPEMSPVPRLIGFLLSGDLGRRPAREPGDGLDRVPGGGLGRWLRGGFGSREGGAVVGPVRPIDYPPPWRAAAALDAVILAVGTLVFLVGDRGVAWAFGLPAAALGALASAGGMCVGCQLYNRRRGE